MAIGDIDSAVVDSLVRVIRSLQGEGGYSTDEDSERERLVRAWSIAAAFVSERIEELKAGIGALSSTELLEDWERALALPNDAARSLEERRQRLRAALSARSFTQSRLDEVLTSLGISSATLYSAETDVLAAGEPEGMFQVGLVIPQADYDNEARRRALASALRRMLPTRARTHLSRTDTREVIATSYGPQWESANAQDGNAAKFGQTILGLQQPVSVLDTEMARARIKSFAPNGNVMASDIRRIQDELLWSSTYLDASPAWSAGFANAGVGGHYYEFSGSFAAGVASLISDDIDHSDRYIWVVGFVSTTDIRIKSGSGTPGPGSMSGYAEACFFYSRSTTTEAQQTMGDGRIRVNSIGELEYLSSSGSVQYANLFIVISPKTGELSTPTSPTGTTRIIDVRDGDSLSSMLVSSWRRVHQHVALFHTPESLLDGTEATPGGFRRVIVLPHAKRPNPGAPPNSYVLDASMDWRERLIWLNSIAFKRAAGVDPDFEPWNVWPGLNAHDRDYEDTAMLFFYSGPGSNEGDGAGEWTFDIDGSGGLLVYAEATTGALMLEVSDAYSLNSASLSFLATAGAQMNVTIAAKNSGVGFVPDSYVAGDLITARELNLPQDIGLYEQAHFTDDSFFPDPTPRAPGRVDAMPLGMFTDSKGGDRENRGQSPSMALAPRLRDVNGGVANAGPRERRQRIAGALRRFTSVMVADGEIAELSGDAVLGSISKRTTVASSFSRAFSPAFGGEQLAAPDDTPCDVANWKDRFVFYVVAFDDGDLRPGGARDDFSFATFQNGVWYTGDGGEFVRDFGYAIELEPGLRLFVEPVTGRLCLINETGVTKYMVGMFEAGPRLGLRDICSDSAIATASASSSAVAPSALTAPTLTWDVQIGNSPTITPGTYSGSPAPTLTYTLYRDGSAVPSVTDVDLATAQAYVAQWDGTAGGDNDIGPTLFFRETATNSTGSATQDTNTVQFDDVTHLPGAAIGVSTQGLTLADADTTVDQWASTLGGAALVSLGAPAAANRPVYEASGGAGGRPSVLFDGVNHGLYGAGPMRGSDWTDCEWGFVGERISYLGAARVVFGTNIGTGTEAGYVIRDGSATSFQAVVNGGGTQNFATDPDANRQHYSCRADATTLTVSVGGVDEGSNTISAVTYTDSISTTLGARFTAARANIRAQAWYVAPMLTATERQHLRALLTYHTGVAS